jgi:hypothetical protein
LLEKKGQGYTYNKLWNDKNIFKVAKTKWHAILKEGRPIDPQVYKTLYGGQWC